MTFCKFASIILLFVFGTIATDLDDSKLVKILKYDFTNHIPGTYFYEYENSDGQTKEERGENLDTSDYMVRGSYSYPGPDGLTYTVHYVADKDGFHPIGDHINVPPYTPWPVNRVLGDEDGHYHPELENNYLPSSEKPPIIDDFASSILTKTQISHEVPSSTPQPPLPTVTNAYIPSPSPSVNVQIQGDDDNDNINRVGNYNTKNVKVLSNAYIPSTPLPQLPQLPQLSHLSQLTHLPRITSVTVTPLSHTAAASTQVPLTDDRGRRGRARNLAAYRKAQNDLFEVIQNNHSSQGVFKET